MDVIGPAIVDHDIFVDRSSVLLGASFLSAMLPFEHRKHFRTDADLQRRKFLVIRDGLACIVSNQQFGNDVVVVHAGVMQGRVAVDVLNVDITFRLQQQLSQVVQALDGCYDQGSAALLVLVIDVCSSHYQHP